MVMTTKELSQAAQTFAESRGIVVCNGILYQPRVWDANPNDWTYDPSDMTNVMWVPLTFKSAQVRFKDTFNQALRNPAQCSEFLFQVEAHATQAPSYYDRLLIKTSTGLMVLGPDGKLSSSVGEFIPNTLPVLLNEDPAAKAEIMLQVKEWLGGDEETAASLLSHLATALAPHWSAIRYILLIGAGRNGKSVLMEMVAKMFGPRNISNITRQDIAQEKPTLPELNNRLANIVFDGPAKYLDDSGTEKALVAGELVSIRQLYSNATTPVQTNALFIEGLNREPLTRDKSTALMARIVRFFFPNVYPDDDAFKQHMLSEPMLGALLSVLIDFYVRQDQKAARLAPSASSLEMEMQYTVENTHELQFLCHIAETSGLDSLIGITATELYENFIEWQMITHGARGTTVRRASSYFAPHIELEPNSVTRRVTMPDGTSQPRKFKLVKDIRPRARHIIAYTTQISGISESYDKTLEEVTDDVGSLVGSAVSVLGADDPA